MRSLEKAHYLLQKGKPVLAVRELAHAKTIADALNQQSPNLRTSEAARAVADMAKKTAIRIATKGVSKLVLKKGSQKIFAPFGRLLRRPVNLTAGNKTVTVNATIDTGATSSVIGMDVAEALGLISAMQRTISARQVRGRLTEYRTYLDKVELVANDRPRRVCSVGPVVIRVTQFGAPMSMLLGNDILSFFKTKIMLSPGAYDIECSSPTRSMLVEKFR